MVNCTICNGNDFTIEAGYYYCSVCGTQSQNIRQIEHSERDGQKVGLQNTVNVTRIQEQKKVNGIIFLFHFIY